MAENRKCFVQYSVTDFYKLPVHWIFNRKNFIDQYWDNDTEYIMKPTMQKCKLDMFVYMYGIYKSLFKLFQFNQNYKNLDRIETIIYIKYKTCAYMFLQNN